MSQPQKSRHTIHLPETKSVFRNSLHRKRMRVCQMGISHTLARLPLVARPTKGAQQTGWEIKHSTVNPGAFAGRYYHDNIVLMPCTSFKSSFCTFIPTPEWRFPSRLPDKRIRNKKDARTPLKSRTIVRLISIPIQRQLPVLLFSRTKANTLTLIG